jgi:NADPH-dependent 2,4-dienoyl-CoA reductase/sulfur reductase-like enzyme
MSIDNVDLVIVGAGPAGLSAACEARKWGISVALLDEQFATGGQIYRGVAAATEHMRAILGADYAAGADLAREFASSGAVHISGAAVWNVGRDRRVDYLRNGANHTIQARHIVLASGAMERPFPISGWTLPGVMGAGAAQIMLKSAGALPQGPVVLAGCGPLLYLLASQYVRAGVKVTAIVQTTGYKDYARAASRFVGALRGWADLRKGLGLLHDLRRHDVPIYDGAGAFSIAGTDRAEAICFTRKGKRHRIEAPLILLHQGVVPNTQITWSLRAKHRWSDAQLCWQPETDEYGQIESTGIYVVGDSRGIVGAKAAASQGRLAVFDIASRLGVQNGSQRSKVEHAVRCQLNTQLHIRPFLDELYRPPAEHRIPTNDSVVVCRCEEVTAGQIRKYVQLGCLGPNQTKTFGRCGMGPCQGRLCGLTVAELIADSRCVSQDEVGYYRIRPPIKPVTLGELSE